MAGSFGATWMGPRDIAVGQGPRVLRCSLDGAQVAIFEEFSARPVREVAWSASGEVVLKSTPMRRGECVSAIRTDGTLQWS